ncbi:MAG: glycosyltransferase [Candidatus Polarisedimenticolia bacterium]
MTRVRIGIHAYQEPELLRRTLESLRANTAGPSQWLLLADGPDAATTHLLSTWTDVPQSSTPDARGAAACFNRLAAADADVVIFLEGGCVVAPGWLEMILSAFESDPAIGLAGPTTNHCWNEQGVYPKGGESDDAIARTAHEAALRFAGDVRSLEPLHSLADFCYAVRRDVIERIGAADEGYALGPCWEMDYNIRAARAGFRGVWVCAAYVHRAPFTPRRRLEEARRFEASKRRYQDKFCGGRLQGRKPDYRAHCRGDACPDFAPASLIAIRAPAGAPGAEAPHAGPAPSRPEPLVSCIMPTADRGIFVRRALRCFLRQDYPRLELVIVDDGETAFDDCLLDDPRIRYIRLDRRLTIGAKRNLACSRAEGEIIVHWDDDDWYPTWRVRTQVRALLDRPADVCGTSRLLYFEPATGRAWEYRYASNPGWLAGNTLAYRRSLWERGRFQDIQVGEDARFLWSARGAAVFDLDERHLVVGMVHAGNTSRKDTTGPFWHPQPAESVHRLLGDDLYLYRTFQGQPESAACPLVSCIMPTYNRRALAALALQSFLYQDYPHRELLVVDDGEDPIGDLLSEAPGVRYFRLPSRRPLGAKRNFACEQASGEIIAQWDDDDWYAPERLSYQVGPILLGQADLTGLENACVLEPAHGRFWTTRQDLHERMFVGNVHGGTLVFRTQLLREGLAYPEINLAEDAGLLRSALNRGKRLQRLSNPGVFVYMRHGSNAWKECVPGRFLNPAGWERTSRPFGFSARALSSYQTAVSSVNG